MYMCMLSGHIAFTTSFLIPLVLWVWDSTWPLPVAFITYNIKPRTLVYFYILHAFTLDKVPIILKWKDSAGSHAIL